MRGTPTHLLKRRVLGRPHDWQHHQPNRPRDPVAIHVQLVEGVEAVLVEVHHHALDHVLERLDREAGVVAHRVDQREVDRVVRLTLPDLSEPLRPLRQLVAQARGVLARLVDDVVSPPAPCIDRPHGLALGLVEKLRAEVEGLGVVRRDLPALLVRLLKQRVVPRLRLRVCIELVVPRQGTQGLRGAGVVGEGVDNVGGEGLLHRNKVGRALQLLVQLTLGGS